MSWGIYNFINDCIVKVVNVHLYVGFEETVETAFCYTAVWNVYTTEELHLCGMDSYDDESTITKYAVSEFMKNNRKTITWYEQDPKFAPLKMINSRTNLYVLIFIYMYIICIHIPVNTHIYLCVYIHIYVYWYLRL